MEYRKPIATPMLANYIMTTYNDDVFHNPNFYKSVVRTLQYVTITRPNLTFTITKYITS